MVIILIINIIIIIICLCCLSTAVPAAANSYCENLIRRQIAACRESRPRCHGNPTEPIF